MSSQFTHKSVLLDEAIESLAIKADGIYLDGTFGRGGHSTAILSCLGEKGRLIALDRDPQAIAFGKAMFKDDPRFQIVKANFAEMQDVADQLALAGKIDGVLLDIGVSSPQLDDAARGFSFMQDGPLDMRMDTDSGMPLSVWLDSADEADIAHILKVYGEERHSRRIARAIVEAHQASPLETTLALAEVVKRANPSWERNKHPATRAFQAFRIFINGELDALEKALSQSVEVLSSGGKLSVISFHSLEDRIVKNFIRQASQPAPVQRVRGMVIPQADDDANMRLKRVGKAIKASADEVSGNARARSAVLRVAEKLA